MGVVLKAFKPSGNSAVEIRDLGALTGPVVCFGGPYSNAAATQALLDRSAELGVAPGNLICTGDVVAYGAEAVATWQLVAQSGCAVVAGNCEKQLAAGADGCGCGFAEGTACDLLSKGWYDHARSVLPATALAWMGAVPDIAVFTHAGRRAAVIHGGVTEISRFIWPSSDVDVFAEEISNIEAAVGRVDMVVAGHCGIAFQRQIGKVLWVNAGAIGLPPHDGRPQTRFVLLEAGGRVVVERLAYDPTPTVAAIVAAGLVQGYDRTMNTGIWPSEDVLPRELRRAL
jgi:predicted phosphodiesterase